MTKKNTAVIIGSGVAGTLVATQILANELYDKVIMLEAGSEFNMGDYAKWLDFVTGGDAPYAKSYDSSEDYTAKGVQPWYINGGRIFGKGGSTLHFGGWLPRFKPEDFELFSRTGRGIDWPFKYEDLEPYYCEAEAYLGVSGDSLVQNPPRSKAYPYEPAPLPAVAEPFLSAFKSLNISYQQLPVTRYGKAENGHGKCQTTGTCDYCPVDGRFNGAQPFRYLETQKNFQLLLNSPVMKIEMDRADLVNAVTYYDVHNDKLKTLSADAVFICCGAIEAPKLLLDSRNKYWPEGIGNKNDLVGRYLSANPFFYVSGETSESNDYQNELGFPTLSSRHYDSPEYQQRGKFFIAMDYNSASVPFADLMLAGNDRQAIQEKVSGKKRLQLYGNLEPLPFKENRVYSDKSRTKHFLPKTVIETPIAMFEQDTADFYVGEMKRILGEMGLNDIQAGSYPQRGDHAACTCRMANSPEDGVVDTDFKVHNINNLYILSNAVMPTLPAANVTLTLVALGFKMMEQIKAEQKVK